MIALDVQIVSIFCHITQKRLPQLAAMRAKGKTCWGKSTGIVLACKSKMCRRFKVGPGYARSCFIFSDEPGNAAPGAAAQNSRMYRIAWFRGVYRTLDGRRFRHVFVFSLSLDRVQTKYVGRDLEKML
jgi:hypothetical protein